MVRLHRFYLPNTVVFITCVTAGRRHLLAAPEDRALFWNTCRQVQAIHPFRLLAHVVLLDHFHWLLWTEEAGGFTTVMHSVKRNFTWNWKRAHAVTGTAEVWQARFWDLVIRDESDLYAHYDYIHWNPVKHGLAERPEDWEASSYRHWVAQGWYEIGWGHDGPPQGAEIADAE